MQREIVLSELNVDDLEALKVEEDGSLDEVYVEKSKKLSYEQRKNLKASDFALIQKVKNKTTGKMEDIMRFPINDEAHVRNCLARLSLAKNITPEEKALVEKRALARAKELGMTDLLKRHMEKSEVRKLLRKAVGKTNLAKSALPKQVSDRVKELIKEGKAPKDAVKQAWTEYNKPQTSKLEKFIGGIKKLASKIREAKANAKSKDLEISSLQVKLEETKPKVEPVIPAKVEEPILETASLKVGDEKVDDLDGSNKRIKKIREQSQAYLTPAN